MIRTIERRAANVRAGDVLVTPTVGAWGLDRVDRVTRRRGAVRLWKFMAWDEKIRCIAEYAPTQKVLLSKRARRAAST